jgi:hypothetical protein
MISSELSSMLAYKLRKVAEAGISGPEIASRIQQILELDRAQKLAADEPQEDFIVPFFSSRKTHLNLV